MGWDFRMYPCSRRELIDECTKDICTMDCVKQSLQGRELWTLWQRKDGSRLILLFLLASKNGCWGVKEISESSGPCYYKCPLEYLAMATTVLNISWRNRVIAYHEAKFHNARCVREISIGKLVALDVPDNEFRVRRLKPLQGVSLKNRKMYRLVKSRVVGVRDDPQTTIQDT